MNPIPFVFGVRFGRLTTVEVVRNDRGYLRWRCICDCGRYIDGKPGTLRFGKLKSCGCLLPDVLREKELIHGMHGTRTYRSWNMMKQRCTNPKAPNYQYYGGRGIKYCERWEKFENFLADMGVRPEGMSIERMDNDGDYEPGNCKWATQVEQVHNSTRHYLARRMEVQN